MIHHGDVRGKGQHGFRLPGLVRCLGAQSRFPMPDRVPAHRTDKAAGQIRQPFDMRSLQCLQRSMGHFDDIPFRGDTDRHPSKPIGLARVRTQLRHGIHTDEAVPAPSPAEFRRFEDECAGTASRQTLIKTHRSE